MSYVSAGLVRALRRGALMTSAAMCIVGLLAPAASAAKTPQNAPGMQIHKGRLTGPAGVEPYSKHPSGTRPHEVCPPPVGHRASCLSTEVPVKHGKPVVPTYEGGGELGGLSPKDLQSAYGLPGAGGKGQTVAIVIAFDAPNLEADLTTYRETYGLPPCTTANGCFEKVNQSGEAGNYPSANAEWAVETSLDVDMVSAACPECHILVVEAENNFDEELAAAEETAAGLGATVISNSWGGIEYPEETSQDSSYSYPGTPVLVASGDAGYGVEYPAASPDVIAVGGTRLHKSESSRGWTETAWSGAGSGCSAYETKPAWQADPGCENRTVADISAVADPTTPVSVYDSYGGAGGWLLVGGTSVATPFVAGVEALSTQAFREGRAQSIYEVAETGQLYDVVEGSNGSCGTYLCQAQPGFDGPTGWGTPAGLLSIPPARTESATIVSPSEVELHGSVNPGGQETSYQFEYGPTASYGSTVPIPGKSVGSGSSPVEVSQKISGLSGQTLYHFRIVATNESEESFHGLDRVFATTPPLATTLSASDVNGYAATLNGEVDPEGIATSYRFEWGLTEAYGHSRPITFKEVGSGTSALELAQRLEHLEPETTYHFRIAARNVTGTVYGEDRTLETGATDWTLEKPVELELGEEGEAPRITGLYDVSCPAADSCVAVGGETNFTEAHPEGLARPLVERWDGESWSADALPSTEEAIPSLAGQVIAEHVYTVSCGSPTWCVLGGQVVLPEGYRLPLLEHWNGASWTIEAAAMEEIGENDGALFRDVSCVSDTACIAVGQYSEHESGLLTLMHGLAVVWNGKEWTQTVVPAGEGEVFATGFAVSCVSAESCLALMATRPEEVQLGSVTRPFTASWNGSEWTEASATVPAAQLGGGMMSCSDGGRALPVCFSKASKERVPHFDGSEWGEGASMAWPEEALAAHSISGLVCLDPSDCVAGGALQDEEAGTTTLSAFAAAWDGQAWHRQAVFSADRVVNPAATGGHVSTTDCHSQGHCVAVGATYFSDNEARPLIERYEAAPRPAVLTGRASHRGFGNATLEGRVNPEGSATTYQFEYGTTDSYGSTAPATTADAGAGSESVQVGEEIHNLTFDTTYHYRLVASNANGTSYGEDKTFSVVTGEEGAGKAVACTGDESCVRVGRAAGESTVMIERWDGVEWSAESAPAPSGSSSIRLSGVDCPSSASCVAVGHYTASNGAIRPLVESWDGESWSLQSVSIPLSSDIGVLEGVSCASTEACSAVGYVGTVGQPATSAWAVGWNGSAWSEQSVSVPAESALLAAISCSAANACTAVGSRQPGAEEPAAEPLALRWNGSSWSRQTTAIPPGAESVDLWGVSCRTSTACTAVGSKSSSHEGEEGKTVPLVEAWDGSSWSLSATDGEPLSSEAHLTAVGSLSVTGGVSCSDTTVHFGLEPGSTGQIDEMSVAPASCSLTGTLKSLGCTAVTGVTAGEIPWAIKAVGGNPPSATVEETEQTYDLEGGGFCPPYFRATGDFTETAEAGGSMTKLSTSGVVHTNLGTQSTVGGELSVLPVREFGGSLSDSGGVSCTQATGSMSLDKGVGGGIDELNIEPANCEIGSGLESLGCTGVTKVSVAGVPWSFEVQASYPLTLSVAKVDLTYDLEGSGECPAEYELSGDLTATGNKGEYLESLTLSGSVESSLGEAVTVSGTWSLSSGMGYGIEEGSEPKWLKLNTVGEPETILYAVSCTEASSCVAVGHKREEADDEALIMRWNGSTWSREAVSIPGEPDDSTLTGVDCRSSQFCMAAGSASWLQGASAESRPLGEEWAGGAWAAR